MANAIETKKLTKVFGDRKALDKVSIEVPEGAFLSIFGPNGAGKTTLVRTLATLSRATSGTAFVAGFDAKEEPDKVREHIGLISHNPMLYPDLTAREHLMFTAQLYGVVNVEERVRELLRAVELDHRRFDVCTHALVLARGRVVSYAPKEDIDFEQFRQLYRETVGMGVA